MENQFKAINLSVPNFQKNISNNKKNFLLSNIFLTTNSSNPIGLYFEKEEEKKAFKSIFLNRSTRYSGIFYLNNKFYSSSLNSISNISSVYSEDIIDRTENKRIIEIIEKTVQTLQVYSNNEIIKNNNELEKHLKLFKIYKHKKKHFLYLKFINVTIKKFIDLMNKCITNLEKEITKLNPIDKIYDNFIDIHIRYLVYRINSLIEKNIFSIKNYKEVPRDDEKIFKEYFNKAIEIIKKIDSLPQEDLKLNEIKKEIMLDFNIALDQKTLSENRNQIFSSYVKDLKTKLYVYTNSIKGILSNEPKCLFFSSRIRILKLFIKTIVKKFKTIKSISNEEALNLIEKLELKFKAIILKCEKEFEISQEIKKVDIHSLILEQIKPLFYEYQSKNNDFNPSSNNTNDIVSNNQWIVFTKKLITEATDLLDEINWKKQIYFYDINNEIINVSKIIKNEMNIYEENKQIYNKLLGDFLEKKNDYMVQNNINNSKLNDSVFANEVIKYESIYNYFSRDVSIIEKMINKNVSMLKSEKSNETLLITRYSILEKSDLFKINIFDLLKNIKNVDNFLIKKIILLFAHFDTSELIVMDNFFSNLEQNNIKIIKQIYLNVIKKNSKTKFWINIEKRIDSLEGIASEISIIDNSKQIESGDFKEISLKPVYNATRKAFNLEILDGNQTPEVFSSIIDYNDNFDYYNFTDNHYLFCNLKDVYQITGKMLSLNSKTLQNENLNNFQNEIEFNRLVVNKNNSNQEIKDKHESNFISEEFLIVDVRKYAK